METKRWGIAETLLVSILIGIGLNNLYFVGECNEIKAELSSSAERDKRIENRLTEIEFNLRANMPTSALQAAQERAEESVKLPEIPLGIIKDGVLNLTYTQFQPNDGLFGVSMRNGTAISNHGMRTHQSYDQEIIHPLADKFVLILMRVGNYTKDGQRLSGSRPIARCWLSCKPVDEN